MTPDPIEELETLLANVTPHDEHLVASRYDHGGGRLFREMPSQGLRSGDRTLIIDAYQEGDREFYFSAVRLVRDLLAVLRQQREAGQQEARQQVGEGLFTAKYLNPGCAEKGCQFLQREAGQPREPAMGDLREALRQLVEQLHTNADEAEHGGDACCAIVRRHVAYQITALLGHRISEMQGSRG